MVYTSDIFSNLKKQFSTWDELSSFLQSPEGGSLRVVQKDSSPYAIVRYVKGQSNLATDLTRWMRSVVWDTITNLPLCVAPPKALYSEIPNSAGSLSVEEFMEGVMVNAFVKETGTISEKPVLVWATRSSIGAESGFYSEMTFSTMIQEALKEVGWTSDDLASHLHYNGQSFASFVLQHPSHRVVQAIQKPNLTLIHLGSVDSTGRVTISDNQADWPEQLRKLAIRSYPPLGEGETAAQRLDTMIRTSEATWQGLVFRGPQGQRWRLRSLSYKILRDLRGKESRIEERFCRVRTQNMVRLYTQTWPEEQAKFFELEKRFRGLTSKVYTEYCAVHKEKSKPFLDVPIPLRTPVYHLHGIYLNNLRPQNLTLKMAVVIQYMNNLPVEAQAALLRSSVEIDLAQGQT